MKQQAAAVVVADDTLEDPMITAFLQAQERCASPPSFDFKDWARLVLVVAIKSRSKQQQQQPHCHYDDNTDRKGVPPMSTDISEALKFQPALDAAAAAAAEIQTLLYAFRTDKIVY